MLRKSPLSLRARLDGRVAELMALPDDASAADDMAAREAVVLAALPLADLIARRYRGRGADPEDLQQVARLGLVKAAKGFRADAPGGFCAYASPTISGEIKRYFRDFQWIVRPPRSLQELQNSVAECRYDFAQNHGRMPTDEEVAEELGLETAAVADIRLSTAAYNALPDDLLFDLPSPINAIDDLLERLCLQRMFGEGVGPRDAQLLYLRFAESRSQASIAAEWGISQMQVSRLLSSLLHRLRRSAEEEIAG